MTTSAPRSVRHLAIKLLERTYGRNKQPILVSSRQKTTNQLSNGAEILTDERTDEEIYIGGFAPKRLQRSLYLDGDV